MSVTQPRLRKVHELGLEVSPGQRCPYCRGDVEPDQWLVGCPCCQTVLHALCAADGRCTTLGCQLGPVAKAATCGPPRSVQSYRPRRARAAPRRSWRVRWARLAGCALLVAAGFGLNHALSLTAPAPLVIVEPPLHQVAPPPTPVVVADLFVPAEAQGDVVFVRGTIPVEAGTVDVVIRSPSGDVTLAAQPPGPFFGAVSLPGPGLHRVTVELTDARGLRQVLSQTVRLSPPRR